MRTSSQLPPGDTGCVQVGDCIGHVLVRAGTTDIHQLTVSGGPSRLDFAWLTGGARDRDFFADGD